ncbi:MAG: DNA polymerase III subunit gamma/tau [Lachnospiraceae bacterium]|nr:DNA polymerase III subunit gamma/tau [Lachnospiraceae bacterium]MDY5742375.1 DNA polymerase III subunit gamma/tau [Lachnospiraceae bacterium]
MSYIALYRKFRPQAFEEVKGQEPIVTALRNQLRSGKIGHAYLFCGTRGTGKTTMAKLFAAAVNCLEPADGNPCGHCELCTALRDNRSMNVFEIDAASNNGVDNIREIREEVAYQPTKGRYKVYIIDEVHMLSPGAFNALLKTLEEPPAYVIFILATTEIHKIPATILSRCQRYDFRRMEVETIVEHLRGLCAQEGYQVTEEALLYIAKQADGAMRDALSILEQTLSYLVNETVTLERVLNILGAVKLDRFQLVTEAVLGGRITTLMSLTEELVLEGKDLAVFTGDLTWYWRNLLLLRNAPALSDSIEASSEDREQMIRMATACEDVQLLRWIRVISELGRQMKQGYNKRILLEITLIKLCKPQMEEDILSVKEQVAELARQLDERQQFGPASGAGARGAADVFGGSPEEKPVLAEEEDEAGESPDEHWTVPQNVEEIQKQWPAIRNVTSSFLKNQLKNVKLFLMSENSEIPILEVEFQNSLAEHLAREEETARVIEEAIAKVTGHRVQVSTGIYRPEAKRTKGKSLSLSRLQEKIKMNIEVQG